MIMVNDGLTVEEWERRVGDQFRKLRLEDNIDRHALARKASVSVGAIANLETGHGTSLRTMIRVAKALGHTEWLDNIAETPEISPLQALRAARGQRGPRQRVARSEGGQ